MQTLSFTHWELRELTSLYHERRNEMISSSVPSKIMKNRANALFDKLRFAEFEERKSQALHLGL